MENGCTKSDNEVWDKGRNENVKWIKNKQRKYDSNKPEWS